MDDDTIPWGELQKMSAMEQSEWWRHHLTDTTHALLSRLSSRLDKPMTDCVVGLIGKDSDLVRQLLMEKRARKLEAHDEAP